MPLSFNTAGSRIDWKAAFSALMEAHKARAGKGAEQPAPDRNKAPETTSRAEPAIRIEISDAARKSGAPEAAKAVLATAKAATDPAAVPPSAEAVAAKAGAAVAEATDAAAKGAETVTASADMAVAGTTAAAVQGAEAGAAKADADAPQATTQDAPDAATQAPKTAEDTAPEEAEMSDVAAARAAAIRLQETSRQQSLVTAIGAAPEGGGLAPIALQSAARAGAAYEASAAAPALAESSARAGTDTAA